MERPSEHSDGLFQSTTVLLFAQQGRVLKRSSVAVFSCFNRIEEMQFDRVGRLADDHADGLPEADVAVVGSVRIGAAAVWIRIAAECRNNRYAIIGRLKKKLGLNGGDFTAFGTGAFGKMVTVSPFFSASVTPAILAELPLMPRLRET